MAIYHIHLDVRGSLLWDDKSWEENISLFSNEKNEPITVFDAKNFLMDELSKNHQVIPIGNCRNFDFEHGCQGHEDDDDL